MSFSSKSSQLVSNLFTCPSFWWGSLHYVLVRTEENFRCYLTPMPRDSHFLTIYRPVYQHVCVALCVLIRILVITMISSYVLKLLCSSSMFWFLGLWGRQLCLFNFCTAFPIWISSNYVSSRHPSVIEILMDLPLPTCLSTIPFKPYMLLIKEGFWLVAKFITKTLWKCL